MARRRTKVPETPKKASNPFGARAVDTFNVHNFGKTYKHDAVEFLAARKVFLTVLPAKPRGLIQTDLMTAMRKALPLSQFPPGRPHLGG